MRKIAAALVLAGLLVLGGVNAVNGAIPGNNGDIKVHDGSSEPTPITKNEPKVCEFHFHGFNFDAGQEGLYWVQKWPEGNEHGTVIEGTYSAGTTGEFVTQTYGVPVQGLFRLFWQGRNDQNIKHKNFTVECTTPSPSISPSPSVSSSPEPSVSPTPEPTPTPSASPTVRPTPVVGTSEPSVAPTPPPTDTDDAINFAATALGWYLIFVLISGAIGLGIFLYFARRFFK